MFECGIGDIYWHGALANPDGFGLGSSIPLLMKEIIIVKTLLVDFIQPIHGISNIAAQVIMTAMAAFSFPLHFLALKNLSSSEFETTDTEDSAIASPASSGLRDIPAKADTPAAIGIPAAL